MQARIRPRPSTARRAAVVALLLALVLAQTLGWMHRALHGNPSGSWPHGPAPAAVDAAAVPASAHAGALHELFGGHAEPTDCRLFDVLGQPGCASPGLLVLPVILPAASLVLTHAGFVARWAALFDARGPPAAR